MSIQDRTSRALACIDAESTRGIEIGPLASPMVRRAPGRQILYADHATTDSLRSKYANHGWDTEKIVGVDIDLSQCALDEAVRRENVDYVVASHVFEHIPDPIGWLQSLTKALRPGGRISLVIPDKRYCFDAKRPASTTGALIEAWFEKRKRPSVSQVFDFWRHYCAVDCHAMWAGTTRAEDLPFACSIENALQKTKELVASSDYADVHCWVFTPASFLRCLADASELGLLALEVEQFFPTQANDLEFFVTLKVAAMDSGGTQERVEKMRWLADTSDPPVAARAVAIDPARQMVLAAARPFYRTLKRFAPAAAALVRRALRD